MITTFWLRPGDGVGATNMLSFFESTNRSLGETMIGLLRADSGSLLTRYSEPLRVTALITGGRQVDATATGATDERENAAGGHWSRGWSCASLTIRRASSARPRRMVAVRQSPKLRASAPRQDTPALQGRPRHAAVPLSR